MNGGGRRQARLRLASWLIGGLAAALGVQAAGAQFVQYTPPGGTFTRPESARESLDKAMDEARWRLGPAVFSPWFAVRDLTYVKAAEDEGSSQLNASVGAGVRGYLPVGSSWTVAGHALPEYVYREEDSWLGGRYGAGLFGDKGRVGIEATVTRAEGSELFSRELEELVDVRHDRAAVSLNVDLGRNFHLFALGTVLRVDHLEEERFPELDATDREERILRSGIRYRTSRGFLLGVGLESSEVDFDELESQRSSSGTAPVLELDYAGERLGFSLDLARRSLRFDQAPEVPGFEGTTGYTSLRWRLFPPLEIEVHTSRDLVYSFSAATPYFDDRVAGAGVRTSLGRWGSFRVFAETGRDDYESFTSEPVDRRDELDTFGGQLELALGPIYLTVTASETEYDSNVPGFDRTVTVVRSSAVIGGSSGSAWW